MSTIGMGKDTLGREPLEGRIGGLSAAELRRRLDLSETDRQMLVAFRRDVHAYPEVGLQAPRTLSCITDRLKMAGLQPRILPGGAGLICDIGPATGPMIALRADVDALPLQDVKDVPYASTVPGAAHACGHDVHTTVVLGAGLVLAELDKSGLLPGPVRLLFEVGEETGKGARKVIAAGGLRGVRRIFGLHCDPKNDAGRVGLRVGPITGSMDFVKVRITGPGGHTSRVHLTRDVVSALGEAALKLPWVLSRRIDARAAYTLVWGRMESGTVANAIPEWGELKGTFRSLNEAAYGLGLDLMDDALKSVEITYGVKAELETESVVCPVVNESASVQMLRSAVEWTGAEEYPAEVSLGGETFGDYLNEGVAGAFARLGVRPLGSTEALDLHRGDFDADEGAIKVGVELLAATALTAHGVLV
ncbi:amidohydrolase [Actinoallomurus purpureus]|uniref:amidohydrolase n=1 Tax=Actinoallomurus purpureus TaxID=478114 RepID=UPI0020932AB4|nr:amidohydrolase [Actinoallomurus purpureus]MCO6007589.1 amidohydrolase [Actinoallomurus purpureus]